ncbi:hypothetical protein [Zymobacter palmae]|uniref:hypothetical protein n=2 Tax=Zymobacter TaxID=33073 RepID=UPI00048313AC|nr:hypothetical protein [Zymobacter palmae]
MLLAVGLAGMLTSPLAHSEEFDQNTALELTQAGAILPLSGIVERLHQQHRLHGLKLLEATLHAGRPHPAYLLELMDDGHYVEDICVDALTAQARSLEACHTAKDRPESD